MVATFSDLTADEQATLLSSPSLSIAAGVELLDFDLTFAADITEDFEASSNDDIVWTGSATIHRDCVVTVSRRLDWGNSLIRVYRIYTDPLTGLEARANRGVFVLTVPDTDVAETPQSWQVNGHDRGYLLDRQIGYSLTYAAGADILTSLADVFTRAGLTGVLIDSTAAGKTFPQPMVFPLVPSTDDTSTSGVAPVLPPDIGGDTAGSGPITWRQAINEISKLITYRFVYANDDGYYVCEPYIPPAARPARLTLDADTIRSTVAVDRTETGNYFAPDIPNLYVFLWSNIPDVSDGAGGTIPATPVEGNGIYTRSVDTGPTSAGARNDLVWPTQVPLTAASQTDLVTQAEAKVTADLQRQITWTGKTVPYPYSHFDVLAMTDQALDGSPWQTEATTWTEHLDGSDTDLTVTKVT